jgi:RTX calcium-binding nonapeptide repeat (4 copies)
MRRPPGRGRPTRSVSSLLTVAFVMLSFLPSPTVAAGTSTCRVPQDEPTLQAALNNNSCDLIKLPAAALDTDVLIDHAVEIVGKGKNETILDGGASGPVIDIVVGTGRVVIRNLTIQNGLTGTGGSGISSQASMLVLDRVFVFDNHAIHNGPPAGTTGAGVYVAGRLTARRSEFVGNTHGGDAVGNGGAIYLATANLKSTITNSKFLLNGARLGGGVWTQSDLVVRNSVFAGNVVDGNGIGGGIFNASADVTVIDSQMKNNIASSPAEGGAYGQYNSAATGKFVRTIFRGNEAPTGGALALDSGNMTISNSSFIRNHALTGFGGAVHNQQETRTTITGSTFLQNDAGNGGGAIATYDNGTELTIKNSTLSHNEADEWGGGIDASSSPKVRLINVTLTNNKSDANEDGGGQGGGFHSDGADFRVKNVVSVNNSDGAGDETADCNAALPTADVVSNGGNIIELAGGCPNIFTKPGDLIGEDADLQILADLGGPTSVHGLEPGSPAIGRGRPGCPKTDQRGAPRKDCDSGAYELVRCEGVIVDVVGTAGNNKLTGTGGGNGILGLGGKDKLNGKNGNDGLCGGEGGDRLSGGGGSDGLNGQGGTDVCIGGPGSDTAKACETEKSL